MFLWAARCSKVRLLNSPLLQTEQERRAGDTAAVEANAERGASCFLRTVVKMNHSAIPRLQRSKVIANRLNSLFTVCLGVRQGAKTMQNEAPTASNKMQVLGAAFRHMLRRKQSKKERSRNPQ